MEFLELMDAVARFFLLGAVFLLLILLNDIRVGLNHKYEHAWRCPVKGCDTYGSSNDYDVLSTFINTHKTGAHGEGEVDVR